MTAPSSSVGRMPGDDAIGEGAPVVACIGYSIPEEVVTAAGYVPLHIVGNADPATPAGDVYMEAGFTHEVRSIFNQVIAGEWDHAALIIIDRSYRDIYYYLKELVRLGTAPSLPPIHLFDFMLSQRMPVDTYNDVQMNKLLDAVGRCAGRKLGDDELRRAISESNRRRSELRRLGEHRIDGRVSGLTAFRAIGAGQVLSIDVHSRKLADLNDELSRAPQSPKPRVVLVSAEQLFHDGVHEAVEAAGAVIVGEDDRWGSRAGGHDVEGGDAASALRRKYHADAVGPELTPFSARAAWLSAFLEENHVAAVVFYVPASDTRFGWDVPELRRIAEASGAGSVLVGDDVLAAGGCDAVVSKVADYLRAFAAEATPAFAAERGAE